MFTEVVLLALAASVSCFDSEVDEKFHKLPHDEFVKYFNSQNFSYKITHYEGIDKKAVGCAKPYEIIPYMPASLVKHNLDDFGYSRTEFDGRRAWRDCFHHPMDQGDCAACWAITTATVASIRKCLREPHPIPIMNTQNTKRDYFKYVLSPADLMCCKDCYDKSFCGEGSTEKAALFWLKHGLVTNVCKPYRGEHVTAECKMECLNDTLYYDADRQFGDSVSLLIENDHVIRHEIVRNGPVVATFSLYQDLKDYKEGVYEHTHGELIGFHSVLVFGFGVEKGVPYWLVANTWGETWGEQGTFKIKRPAPFLDFEKQMLSLTPKLYLSPVPVL